MTEFKYHIFDSVKPKDYDPEYKTKEGVQFEQRLDLELTNLDISLVNGLRRVLLAEVETASISPEVLINDSENITVFNTELLKERFALIPVHLDNVESLEDFRKSTTRLLFKLADPNNWNKPIVNEDNQDRIITCKDILVLEKKQESPHPLQQLQQLQQLDEEDDENNVESNVERNVEEDVVDPESSKSPETMMDQYNLLDSGDYFKYGEMYLVKLKKGESLYLTMYPQVGTGTAHARWHSCVPIYRFKTRKEFVDNQYDWHADPNYDSIKDIQDYQPSKNPEIAKYRVPETFKLSFEYNGHYRPSLAWILAISSLKTKMEWFMEQIRLINGTNGKVSDRLLVEFSPPDRIRNMVTLTVLDESHTLGNIISSHYLYNLERLVKIINPDNADKIILNAFSHYRVPYILDPIENKLVIDLKTPEWSNKQIIQGFDTFTQSLQTNGETVNLYDDDFYIKNPTIRLLMIVNERILNTLGDLLNEGEEILKMVENTKPE